MSAAKPSGVPIGALLLVVPFGAAAVLDGWLAAPLVMAFPVAAGVLGSVPGARPASSAPYGTAAVLHAVSTPAAPRTPAPSSTQRLVAH
jgi:hypothetical protein